jgi:phosphodiesterase/alkaline phosphatase D-like protein
VSPKGRTKTAPPADAIPAAVRFAFASCHNNQRGYARCVVTPSLWRTDYQVVPYVTREGAPLSTRASFVIEDGQPGLRNA